MSREKLVLFLMIREFEILRTSDLMSSGYWLLFVMSSEKLALFLMISEFEILMSND